MGRKKVNKEIKNDVAVNNSEEIQVVEVPEDFINPPEETESCPVESTEEEMPTVEKIEEPVEEIKVTKQKSLRKVLRFTPVGPKIEWV